MTEVWGQASSLFRGLSDPSRLAILRELTEGEQRVTDLVATVGLAQGTISGHLACLRDCGLVLGRPEGRQVFYSLAHPELLDLFLAADRLLARTGSATVMCATYGAACQDTETPRALDAQATTSRGDVLEEARRG